MSVPRLSRQLWPCGQCMNHHPLMCYYGRAAAWLAWALESWLTHEKWALGGHKGLCSFSWYSSYLPGRSHGWVLAQYTQQDPDTPWALLNTGGPHCSVYHSAHPLKTSIWERLPTVSLGNRGNPGTKSRVKCPSLHSEQWPTLGKFWSSLALESVLLSTSCLPACQPSLGGHEIKDE